jgi:hypothetical protein
MHVFPNSPVYFRTIYTVGSANRFCNVNHTISHVFFPHKKDVQIL